VHKRTMILTSFVLFLSLVLVGGAHAGGWTKRVSGGMSYASPYGEFTVTLSAWDNGNETNGGQGQYYYPPLDRSFHLKVSELCTGQLPDGPWAVAIGKVSGQDGTEVTGDGYGAIAVIDRGKAGDGVRVAFYPSIENLEGWCDNRAEGKLPAKVVDGNFHIRSR
jgi:hypothetical protein